MRCRECENRVSSKDKYCVYCAKRLRLAPRWAKWTFNVSGVAIVALVLVWTGLQIGNCSTDTYHTHILTTAVDDTVHGSIDPALGQHGYESERMVTITANPASGWRFDHWDGDVYDPTLATTVVTMNGNKTVTACFVAITTPAPTPTPDLTVQDIVWVPTIPLAGSPVTVSVTVKNQGTGTGAFDVCFYVDNVQISSANSGSMSSNATVTKQFTWTAQAGSHAFKAVADCKGAVTESDETNNGKEVALTIEQTVDNRVFYDGFESGDLRNWQVSTVGSVPSSVSLEDKHSGVYALKIGPSSCGASCFDAYQVKLQLSDRVFPQGEYIISCYRREPYDWGGSLRVYINGVQIGANAGTYSNQHTDSGWYEVRFSYTGSIETLVLQESDLTSAESIFLDDISIMAVA
jgi:hypothetical protein